VWWQCLGIDPEDGFAFFSRDVVRKGEDLLEDG
jgi:hypothetical protein